MKFESIYETAKKTIADSEGKKAASWDEAFGIAASVEDTRHTVALYEDVYARLTAEEIALLRSVPVYALNDVRALKPIKDKYSISWNDVRTLVRAVI